MDLKTIVVGFDGSGNARKALETAAELAGEDTTVHVVTAYDPPSDSEVARIMSILPDEFKSGFDPLEGPRGHLRDAEQLLERRGVEHKGHFVQDKPAAAILDTSDAVDADLIIVGSRGLGRGTRFIRGSVSTRVAAHAARSFLVIHDDDKA